jgi:YD repeat-containing protein
MPHPVSSFLHRIDPRQRLSTALGWLVFGLALALAVVAAVWVGQIVRSNLLQQYSLRLASAADHIASELNLALAQRLQSVSISAAMLSDDVRRNEGASMQRVLTNVQASFPDFVWIAAADADGQIIAATDPKVIGNNVYQYAWFAQGFIVSWIEEGVSFNNAEYKEDEGETGTLDTGMHGKRFLKLTAPIRGDNGGVLGVVAARLSWDWVLQMVRGINKGMSDVSREEWLLIDRDDIVRIGPPELVGKNWHQDPPPVFAPLSEFGLSSLPPQLVLHRMEEGRGYLVAQAQQGDNESLQQLGWRVVAIQPLDQAVAAVTRVQWQIATVLLGLGIVAAFAGLSLARRLTRRVRMIASSADDVLAGTAQQIAVPAGVDEAARLGAALDRLLRALQQERDDLRQLNAELDQRVADRTQEIQRLAEEARYSAVVRERLKIARDLHDTLAHSMMAMLTEIRLLKKLAATQPEALAEELIQAEDAARQGLQEARAAIGQIRYNPVRDVGLGVALQDHLNLFADRTGLNCHFDCDPSLATFSEERAETFFRIAEEALRNVERHARARSVTLSLHRIEDGGPQLQMAIVDDGIGFEPDVPHHGHYGLVGLREQAQLAGAQLSIASEPQQGTRVTVRLRLAQA